MRIEDEYDVQDLLHALLRLHFDDIRAEEWTPSYCSKSSRVDFILPNEKIVIEVKKTRDKLREKELGDQLIIDKERYRTIGDCDHLICFIYDPDGYIMNPIGFRNDLESSDRGFRVSLLISPQLVPIISGETTL